MSILRCKMCGGSLEINNQETVAVCRYCGMKQMLPKINNEKIERLYDRASYFRRNNEFDKALSLYEEILNENHTDAETYWSLVLCRYGIEYVEEPVTQKKVATINRVQYASILQDEDYQTALRYADSAQRELYESEAKYIAELQKTILKFLRMKLRLIFLSVIRKQMHRVIVRRTVYMHRIFIKP